MTVPANEPHIVQITPQCARLNLSQVSLNSGRFIAPPDIYQAKAPWGGNYSGGSQGKNNREMFQAAVTKRNIRYCGFCVIRQSQQCLKNQLLTILLKIEAFQGKEVIDHSGSKAGVFSEKGIFFGKWKSEVEADNRKIETNN